MSAAKRKPPAKPRPAWWDGAVFWSAPAAHPHAHAAHPTDATPSPIDEAMMRRALELARAAAEIGEVPIGAVVYELGGEHAVLGEGYNRREIDGDPTAHAEMIAIRAAAERIGDWRLEGCGIAVTLEPCPMCAGAIVNSRIERVVYGAPDPKAGAVRTLHRIADDARLNHRAGIVPGVLADVCASELRSFFRSLRERNRARRGGAV